MGKRSVYTKITPLPRTVPRQLALDMLHSHTEVIELNPLVTGVKAVSAPRDCASDEYFSQWYEISEVITGGFGIKKKIQFKGVFHDQPWGLQSHVYAPFGVDLRNKYRIGGNQPGEPAEEKELGVDTPREGLYLREDVEIICSVPLTMGFVKKETKAATGIMIDRMTRKAELLDEGKLHAMFEDGRMKTLKPPGGGAGRMGGGSNSMQHRSPMASPMPSPVPQHAESYLPAGGMQSPGLDAKGFGRYHDVAHDRHMSMQSNYTNSNSNYTPSFQQPNYAGPPDPEYAELPTVSELPGNTPVYPPEKSPRRPSQQQLNQTYQPSGPHSSSSNSNTPADSPTSPSDARLRPPPLTHHPKPIRSELPGDTTSTSPSSNATTSPTQPPPTSAYQITNPNATTTETTTKSKRHASALEPPTSRFSVQHRSQHTRANSDNPHPHTAGQSGLGISAAHARAPAKGDAGASESGETEPRKVRPPYPESPPESPVRTPGAERNGTAEDADADPNEWPLTSPTGSRSRSQCYSPAGEYPRDEERGEEGATAGAEESERADEREGKAEGNAKCPVCEMFEGDERAVQVHVERAHFG